MVDLLVIGAGLSGLTAALAAAEAGLSARIVAKGMGAHHWSAGTIDLLGALPGDETLVADPFAAMERLPDGHPYHLIGSERVAEAVARLQAWLEEAGLPYRGAPDAGAPHADAPHADAPHAGLNLLLPSPVGAPRPVYLAPLAQLGGSLQDDRPMLILGIEGMRDLYPHLIAENLVRLGVAARAAFVPWEAVATQRDRNTIQLAHDLEQPAQLDRLAAALRPLVKPGERIGLPAILGMDAHADVFEGLQSAVGAPLFEIPTLPPSVPGVRLFNALRRVLGQHGVRIETNMEVMGFHAAGEGAPGDRIEWVESATAARPLRHRARAYLLATGGVLGGGIASAHDGRIWETIFDLPLTVAQDRREWFHPLFLDPAGQPVFRAGISVDEELRPLAADGSVAFANLWAAGDILAHADPILERSLEGVSCATGTAAAQALAQALTQAAAGTGASGTAAAGTAAAGTGASGAPRPAAAPEPRVDSAASA